MLFNSLPFLLVFLPIAFALHESVQRIWPKARLPLLVLLSSVFYGYWDWRFLPLLAFSIVLNWTVSRVLPLQRMRVAVAVAIAANLLVLALFKYGAKLNQPLTLGDGDAGFALPLGISFFTFHHVMYLVDLRRGLAPRYSLVKYALYIAFFPQVLAGPLVRWREIMHQFEAPRLPHNEAVERMARGLILLVLGLAKKVFISEPLAGYADPIFMQAHAHVPTIAEAWQATLAFSLQIYFDFSGYTDMALGIGLLFGIVLPQNFAIPYRAPSLREFWRRWHITLSRFLRDYLYIPLGGSQHGLALHMVALLTTMTLGGLWHGLGSTLLLWGFAHGIGLCAGVLWQRTGLSFPSHLGWLVTTLFVIFTWVLFRSPTIEAASHMYEALLGFSRSGADFKWRALIPGAAFALAGPTAWTLAQRFSSSRWLAMGAASLLVLVLMRIGDGANDPFLYFQF